MIYFILSIIVNLIIIYNVYNKLLLKISAPEVKEKSEINSIIVEFNKVTKNNIDLLEEKVAEIKNLLLLADRKMAELKNIELGTTARSFSLNVPLIKDKIEIKEKEIKNKAKKEIKNLENPVKTFIPHMRNYRANKGEIIKKYLKEGHTENEIAKEMGISTSEVELYMGLIQKK